jgi:predicted transcriptional regulator of viral defense system
MAETLGTNDTNIRVMLSRLSEKGFVKRIATDDRRYGKIIIK